MTPLRISARYDASALPPEPTIWDRAAALAEREPDRTTHVFEDERCRADALVAEALRLSAALQAHGYRTGDVLAFQLPNWREALVIDLACARLGLVIVPIVPIYRDAELSFMLSDCGAKGIFVPGEFRGHDFAGMLARLEGDLPTLEHVFTVRADAAPASYEALIATSASVEPAPPVDPDGVKLVLYTSGTTARPKAVLHSHNSRARDIARIYADWQQGESDVMLMASPITHISGFGSGLELPYLTGRSSYPPPDPMV